MALLRSGTELGVHLKIGMGTGSTGAVGAVGAVGAKEAASMHNTMMSP